MTTSPKSPLFTGELSKEQVQKIESLQPLVAPLLRPTAPSGCCPPSGANCCAPSPAATAASSCCDPQKPENDLPSGNTAAGAPCCGPRIMPKLTYIPVTSQLHDGIPQVDTILRTPDKIGAFRARMGKFRMNYAIQPGLYALGTPDRHSDVLVTANYKLSFDHLRSHLAGLNVWILVLDTWGINVWCAAGKGTFGTSELIHRIEESGLANRVSTRKLILPQLGAPGIASHEVKNKTGFSVVWGPVEAADIQAFLQSNCVATPAMRQKNFPLRDRLVLLPIELRPALKLTMLTALLASPLAAIAFSGDYLQGVVHYGILIALFLLTGVFAGAVVTPLLLPYLPGRAFSVKSILPAALTTFGLSVLLQRQIPLLELTALAILAAALAAFVAMNFTGASTYTSISGVKKEMRFAVPVQIAATALSVALWITAQLLA